MGNPDNGRSFGTGMSTGTDNLAEGSGLTPTLDEQATHFIREIDSQTLDPEQYQHLDPVAKRSVDLDLLRKGDQNSIAKLSTLEPEFEMQYPLSYLEGVTFSEFEDYVNGGIRGAGYVANLGTEVSEALNQERERRQMGLPEPAHRRIDGFKLKRWERWRLEEQIRQEREALEERGDLPQAA